MLIQPGRLKKANLPPMQGGFWKLAGPGAVLVGLSVGAGEIIIWPRIAAQYGAGMAWAACLGVVLQLFLNIEIGRWCVATGESIFAGYQRMWKGWAPIFLLLTVLGWLAPGWGRASAQALKALAVGPQGPGADWVWTGLSFGAIAALLFGSRRAYRAVELAVQTLVVVMLAGLVVVAAAVGTRAAALDLLKGIFNLGWKHPEFSTKALFIALVFAGAGGTANLFYSFYLRAKGIGMPAPGAIYPETSENQARFRDWFGWVIKDQILFFWLLNTLTLLLFIFGALAVLHPRGLVPAQGSLIWDEAAVLAEVWGEPGRRLFLLIGFATLFSTQLTLVDGVARSLVEIVRCGFSFGARLSERAAYVGFASAWMVLGTALTFAMERAGVSELGFLFNAAYMGGFAMAAYAPLTLWMNRRLLPQSARPGPWLSAAGLLVSAVYIVFALYCLAAEFIGRP